MAQAESFLQAVGDAMTEGAVHTQTVQASPAAVAAAQADIEAFIREKIARLEARAGDAGVEARVYAGACLE